jgi:hypothetical protein
LKTVDKAGGLDAYLIKAKPDTLPVELRRLRKVILARKAAATPSEASSS